MKIAAAATALPVHTYDQETLTDYLAAEFDEPRVADRLRALHRNTKISERRLALPLEQYAALDDFSKTNRAWVQAALDLGQQAIEAAVARAGLRIEDLDAVFFATVTGLASPSIDARLMNRLPFRPDLKRVPIFGLGCVAGAAAVSRAADYLRGHPGGAVLVLAIELCSLTLQRGDRSIANLISTGLFSDGAAAAVLVGAEHEAGTGPEVLATRSVFYPDTEQMMGWDIGAHGFRIELSAQVPAVARERLPIDVAEFLRAHELTQSDIVRWIAHPGGPKVLQALQDGLELADDDVALSWESLARAGNMSSVSVLAILDATLQQRPGDPGDRGVMLAMGPGFCSELLLLGW